MKLLMIPQVRTTIEDRVMILLYFSLIWSRHSDKKVAGLKKWVWQALYINKIKKENHNLHIFKT